jgi:hypothetical protein
MQNFIIELDGKAAGRFMTFSGGTVQADVATAAGPVRLKHVTSVRYEDIRISCGTGMSRTFYDWIGSSFSGAPVNKNGAIVAFGSNNKPSGRLEFFHAYITGLLMPALDRNQKKAAFMQVQIHPEMTRASAAPASANPGVYASMLPKSWSISDFRLSIPGLEKECPHVFQIGSLQLGQKTVEDFTGAGRVSDQVPGSTEFSNISLRLPENHATGFYKWFDDFVVKGNSGPQDEKKGTLEFFAPNSTKAYFEIQLAGLGIFNASGPTGMRGNTGLPVDIGLYCESMKFSAGPAAIA